MLVQIADKTVDVFLMNKVMPILGTMIVLVRVDAAMVVALLITKMFLQVFVKHLLVLALMVAVVVAPPQVVHLLEMATC
jgi:hypothetical protein